MLSGSPSTPLPLTKPYTAGTRRRANASSMPRAIASRVTPGASGPCTGRSSTLIATSTSDTALLGSPALGAAAAGETAPGESGLGGVDTDPGDTEAQPTSRTDPVKTAKQRRDT